MGTKKKSRKNRMSKLGASMATMSVAVADASPGVHRRTIPALRQAYTEVMDRPEFWWIQDECIEVIGKTLSQRNYVVIDGFMGESVCKELRQEVKLAYEKGAMIAGNLAGGSTGGGTTYTMENVRGDYMGWFTGKEENLDWKRLPDLLVKMDTLVSELKSSGHAEGLTRVDTRSNAMCTCYPGSGARYIRHCDNPNANGRILTAIYYMNSEWQNGDGGELRIYSCLKSGVADGFTDCDGRSLMNWDKKHENEGTKIQEESRTIGPGVHHISTVLDIAGVPDGKPVKVDEVQPRGDRLLLLYSNERVPHEVLPTHTFRYAVTTWFMSAKERATAKDTANTAQENKNVVEEMDKMTRLYGGKPQPNNDSDIDDKAQAKSGAQNSAESVASLVVEMSVPPESVSEKKGARQVVASIAHNPEESVASLGVEGSIPTEELVSETKEARQGTQGVANVAPTTEESAASAVVEGNIPPDESVRKNKGARPGMASSESEASSDSEPNSTVTVMAVRTYVDAPLYSLREIEQAIRADDQHNDGQTSRRALEISVLLPLIEAIQEVELDVSPLNVSLQVPGKYALFVPLPCAVDTKDARAKFRIKERRLTVKLPIVEQ
mmetsp:Transcript_4660/g.7921  ORF Transcript_4660/g.7921 Transcript_4660/m.7921 type:complete len:608 (+) Transcript_4660:131-1954(+)